MKDHKKAYGLCPASMTIWNADQTYNKTGMEKYLTWLLDNGAQTISICGSTGENIAMNMEEQREIIAHVSSFLAGQVPLVCGTGRYDTLNTIKMSKFAQDHGADCVMVILPFYLNPHKKAVLQHFRDIRAALDIDIMVYNNPWFAGYELNTEDTKAYVTDLFSPYITVFDPRTCKITGAIHTGQAPSTGSYNSTEQMAQYDKWVFVNCWSYSNKILVIDSEQDKVVHEIELRSIQPNSLVVDRNGKLWALTDGGYAGSEYGQTEPCLYRIDAATWRVEQEFVFEKEEYPSELCINGAGDVLYFINDGICKMSVTAAHAPVRPLIPNERRHQIYGLAVDPTSGEIYVGDAIDFEQPGVVYRYRDTGQSAELVDSFGVGMLPSAFAFK